MQITLDYIFRQVINESFIGNSKVKDAINGKYQVIINYNSHGQNVATGWRIIEVFAYGLTKAGNPVIRAYQPYGDTDSSIPAWKFFRLDRILSWKKTGRKFEEPRPMYNPNGDKSMSVVYMNAKFDDNDNIAIDTNQASSNTSTSPRGPRRKDEPENVTQNQGLYVPDGESMNRKKLEKLNQQLKDPVFLNDFMNKKKEQDAFGDIDNETQPESGARRKDDNIEDISDKQTFTNKEDDTIFKTDTEKQIDRIKKQMRNPQYVDQSVLDRYNKEKERRNRFNKNRK